MNTPKSFIKSLLRGKNPACVGRRHKAEPCKRYVQVSHCIFDLDGAVLDNHQVIDRLYQEVFEKYGQRYTQEWRHKIMGMSQKALWQKVIRELRLKVEWQRMLEDYQRLAKGALQNAPLMPGIERLVEHLEKHKVPIAAITSSDKDEMRSNTQHIQKLMSKFEHVVCGDDPQIPDSKPAHYIYRLCALRFSGKPESETCLVFEDTAIGVSGAKVACMQVIGVPSSPTTVWALRHANEVIGSLNDFRPGKFGMPPLPEQNGLVFT